MKPLIYVLFFIIIVSSVTAGVTETGKVSVEVVNEPPRVIDVKTSEPFENEPLVCDPVIEDEIEDGYAAYHWYKNNVLIDGQAGHILGEEFFQEGDVITCEVTPNDLVQDGESKSVSVVIKPRPFASAITGAVVGVGRDAGFFNSFLLLLLLALVIFNVAYFFRKR